MNNYRPRRASRRWLDGDCPREVLAIFDNGGLAQRNGSFDRYTVFYAFPSSDSDPWGWIGYRGMSEHPTSPTGFGIYAEMQAHEMRAYRRRVWRQSCRWTDLPAEVQDVVRRDCTEFAAIAG